jgi:hypothetical protein
MPEPIAQEPSRPYEKDADNARSTRARGDPVLQGQSNIWDGLPTELENRSSGALFARASTTSIRTRTIDAWNDSPESQTVAVRGIALATFGVITGVEGICRSNSGVGVRGFCDAGSGVRGDSTTGIGVRGFASADTGGAVGVLGTCASPPPGRFATPARRRMSVSRS